MTGPLSTHAVKKLEELAAPTPIDLICETPDEVMSKYDRSPMRGMIANPAPWSLALKRRRMARRAPQNGVSGRVREHELWGPFWAGHGSDV
jgi:hypothetical protein